MDLEGKVVAIIGASSGIGKGTARAAIEKNPRGLILAARREELLNKLAAEFNTEYSKTETIVVPTDVTKHSSLQNLINRAIDKYGQLDIIINSAGVLQEPTPIDKNQPERNDLIIATNLNQALNLAHFFVPRMKQQKSGIYLVVSSQASKYAFPGQAAYNASKAGIDHGIRSIDEDLKPLREQGHDLYVFSVGPGFINTEEAKRNFPEMLEAIEKSPTPEEFGEILMEYATNPKAKYEQHGPTFTLETVRV